MSTRLSIGAGLLALAALFASTTAGASLVTNGGFETGDITGWTEAGNAAKFTGVDPSAAHTGKYGYFAGPFGAPSSLSQNLITVVGTKYQVDFWLQAEADPNGVSAPNEFQLFWGGNLIQDIVDSGPFGYRHFVFDVIATAPSTSLSFGFRNDPAFWDLDDVSVVVPEPGSLALVGLAGFAAVLVRRRKAGPQA